MTGEGQDPSGGLLVLLVAAVWSLPYAVAAARYLRRRR